MPDEASINATMSGGVAGLVGVRFLASKTSSSTQRRHPLQRQVSEQFRRAPIRV